MSAEKMGTENLFFQRLSFYLLIISLSHFFTLSGFFRI